MDTAEKRALIDKRLSGVEIEAGDIETLDAVLNLAAKAEGFDTESMSDTEAARAVIGLCREVYATFDAALGEGTSDYIFDGMRRTVTLTIYAFSRFAALVRSNAAATGDEITELLATVEDAPEA